MASESDHASDHTRVPTSVLHAARPIVADLAAPRPIIYWTDLLATLTVGYGATAVYLGAGWFSVWQVAAFLIASLALYRAALFVHEIVHFHPRQMRAFRGGWDLLVGVPLLIPSFLYESHRSHHNTHEYGTDRDGEYLPFGTRPWYGLVGFLLQIFVQPLLIVGRFAVLTPLSFLNHRLRQWTLQHASSLVIDFRYQRLGSEAATLARVVVAELVCCAWAHLVGGLVAAGVVPWTWLPQLYLLSVCGLLWNHLRTLAAHRYLSGGQAMTFEAQLEDSTTIEGGLLTGLLCPLGLRYHALHHLFPRLPYHNLGTAHRRLMSHLTHDSPYRATVYRSWFAVMRELWGHTRRGARPRA